MTNKQRIYELVTKYLRQENSDEEIDATVSELKANDADTEFVSIFLMDAWGRERVNRFVGGLGHINESIWSVWLNNSLGFYETVKLFFANPHTGE